MNKIWKFIISLGIPLAIGAIASFATASWINSWYIMLEKPFFNPPNWIFWPVWTLLYIFIWVAFFRVWNKDFWRFPKSTKIIYFLQLFLNFLWSFSFFYFENPLLWLINIVGLLIIIILNIVYFYKTDTIAWILLVPYLLWVSFATILNFSIFILN